jgi:hypothetical protein
MCAAWRLSPKVKSETRQSKGSRRHPDVGAATAARQNVTLDFASDGLYSLRTNLLRLPFGLRVENGHSSMPRSNDRTRRTSADDGEVS